jgi:hypothetical protein
MSGWHKRGAAGSERRPAPLAWRSASKRQGRSAVARCARRLRSIQMSLTDRNLQRKRLHTSFQEILTSSGLGHTVYSHRKDSVSIFARPCKPSTVSTCCLKIVFSAPGTETGQLVGLKRQIRLSRRDNQQCSADQMSMG